MTLHKNRHNTFNRQMDLVTALTLAVATISLALIVNLFISLRQADHAVEQLTVSSSPAPTEAKKQRKPLEKSKKTRDSKKPLEFKHPQLYVNLKGHTIAARSGAFAVNGKFVVSGDAEQSILLWVAKDFNRGNTHVRLNTGYDPILSVSFSPDSKAIVAALEKTNSTRVYKINKKPTQYELVEAVRLVDLHPTSGLVRAQICVQFSSGVQSGAFLFHEYHDSTVVLTDLRGIELARIKCGGGDRHQIRVSGCGRYIAVCGDSPELRAWAVVFKGGKFVEIRRLPSLIGHKPKIVRFAFSPDSTRLLTLDNDEVAKVWEMNDWANQQTPRELFQFSNPFGLPSLMAISPDNLTVAMAHLNRLTTFALADSTVTDSIDAVFASSIHQLVFSPDSEYVVVTGDKCVRLLHHLTGWRARLRDCEKRLQLASSETHQNGLREEIAMTKSRISLLT